MFIFLIKIAAQFKVFCHFFVSHFGTKHTFNPDKCTVNIPIDISPFVAANSLFLAANWDIPDADGIEVFKKFVSEVVKVHSPIHISAYICSPLSGVNITSRYKVDIKGDDSEESIPIVHQTPQIFVMNQTS